MVTQQLSCNTRIDYSTVIGNRILPFLIELDLQSSVLYPEPGQNQKFCYEITGIGQNNSTYADLSHFVLGICSEIPANQIVNISVYINGEEQEVDFGEDGNVELKSPDKPDPPTKCPGLKFDFGLNKVSGSMTICFELTTPYPVGANPVCLFGGNTTAQGLSICGPACSEVGNCTTIAYQPISVCAPVTITPFVRSGVPTIICCDSPTITPGASTCPNPPNDHCSFTITQQLCVAIPIHFGARTFVGAPVVQCGTVDSNGDCPDCNESDISLSKASVINPSTIKLKEL